MTDDNTLWAVHVEGPDDVLPMADQLAAFAKAEQINEVAAWLRSRVDVSPLDPWLEANVCEWDGTPEEHAAGLRDLIEGEYTP